MREIDITAHVVREVPLVGGNADGQTVRVPEIAGHLPRFVGVEHSSYLLVEDGEAGPVYRWEQVGEPGDAPPGN